MNTKFKMLFVIFAIVGTFLTLQINDAIAGTSANSGSTSASGANAYLGFDDHSKTKVIDRNFVGSSPSVTGQTHPLFVDGDGEDNSFRGFTDLIKFGAVFSESALKNLARGGDVNVYMPVLTSTPKPSNKYGNQRWIKLVAVVPVGFKATAPVDSEADDFDTNSFQVIARTALDAIENGDNVLWIEWEGYQDKVRSTGWGIGSHTATGVVTETGKVSGVAGGGWGYSSNSAGKERKPWIRGYAGFIPGLDTSEIGFEGPGNKTYRSNNRDKGMDLR